MSDPFFTSVPKRGGGKFSHRGGRGSGSSRGNSRRSGSGRGGGGGTGTKVQNQNQPSGPSSHLNPNFPSDEANKRKRVPNDRKISTRTQLKLSLRGGKKESMDEEIDSSSEGELNPSGEENSEAEDGNAFEQDNFLEETAEEKRLRLAKLYIQQLEEGQTEDELDVDAKDIDRDNIANRLRRDVLESQNQLYFNLTAQVPIVDSLESSLYRVQFKKVHKLSVTCSVIDPRRRFLFTASKDCAIVKLDFHSLDKLFTFQGGLKRTKQFPGHTDHILALAISEDGSLLASGGKDKVIHIWDVVSNRWLGSLNQHKDAITGLVFRKGSYDLYSSSLDRSVKVWNAKELTYVETLFGHQDAITDIDALYHEQCVTVGSRDKSLRLWKIVEQTQLIFRAATSTCTDAGIQLVEGSLDKVRMVDPTWYVTGGDSGTLSLWHTGRKKPVHSVSMAHGLDPTNQQPYPIHCLAVVPYTDLLVSGSEDGKVRLWAMEYGAKRSLTLLTQLAVDGFVNCISTLSPSTTASTNPSNNLSNSNSNWIYLVLAIGQEHPYGRWKSNKQVQNGILKIEIPLIGNPQTTTL